MLDCPNTLSQITILVELEETQKPMMLINVFPFERVTAQDISMMIGCGHRSIIFLIDNGGYTIDVEIHDGPYNVIIKMWNYTGLVDAIHYGDGCYSQWGRQMLDYQVMLVVTPTRKVKVGFG